MNSKKNQPHDAPRAVITQWRVLILVIGFFHPIPFTGGNEENQVESNCLTTFFAFDFFCQVFGGRAREPLRIRVCIC